MSRNRTTSARMRRVAVFAALLWACTVVARAEAPSAGGVDAAEPEAVSEELRALLGGEDTDERLGDEERDYFDRLPATGMRLLEDAVRDEWVTSTAHLNAILSLRLPIDKLETVMTDNCFLCHTDPESHTTDTLLVHTVKDDETPGHMSLDRFGGDVHVRAGLSCSGCHGGDRTEFMDHDFPDSWPESAKQRRENRGWVAEFCGRCHSDVNFMRTYNAQLPTDQQSKYLQSRHAKSLLANPGSGAAECVSCHGVHGILSSRDPRSPVHPRHVPGTCAGCHADEAKMANAFDEKGNKLPTNQYEKYVGSVHGRALLEEGDLAAPACNDCHGNHASQPVARLSVAQSCRNCHTSMGAMYDTSTHKKVFGEHGWPECGTCHGNHSVYPASTEMIGSAPGTVCGDCHRINARFNPLCSDTADHFREELLALSSRYEKLHRGAEKMARRGLDVEPVEAELETVADGLRATRSSIHAFDWTHFDETAVEPNKAADRIDELMALGDDELRWRRKGLFFSLAVMAVLLVLIRLKLAELERRGE